MPRWSQRLIGKRVRAPNGYKFRCNYIEPTALLAVMSGMNSVGNVSKLTDINCYRVYTALHNLWEGDLLTASEENEVTDHLNFNSDICHRDGADDFLTKLQGEHPYIAEPDKGLIQRARVLYTLGEKGLSYSELAEKISGHVPDLKSTIEILQYLALIVGHEREYRLTRPGEDVNERLAPRLGLE